MEKDGTMTTRNYERYSWPGGYERFAVMDDSGLVCIPCCNDPSNPIHEIGDGFPDGWEIHGFGDMSVEDEPVYCDHCGRRIE